MQGTLPRRLRILRQQRGLTLREASELTGVRPSTLSELERGLRHPHDLTLNRIAAGYGVEFEELLEEELAGKDEAPPEEEGRQIQTRVKEPLEVELGHSYLAMTYREADESAKSLKSRDEVFARKDTLDFEWSFIDSFLKNHEVDEEQREGFREAKRQHLYWMKSLDARIRELRDTGEGEGDKVLVMTGGAVK